MAIKEITIGDISDAWLVGVLDSAKVPIPLTGFSCKVSVVHTAGSVAVEERPAALIENEKFVVYLTDTETLTLTKNQTYRCVIQVENLTLPKPIKKEVTREFKAVEGFIS